MKCLNHFLKWIVILSFKYKLMRKYLKKKKDLNLNA